jgi:hypothetical protein
MWFRLASHLGCTVRELQERMDSREFSEWCAFNRIDPWTRNRMDLGFANVCSIIANANSAKGRRFKAEDFMPRFGVVMQKGWKAIHDQFKAFANSYQESRKKG